MNTVGPTPFDLHFGVFRIPVRIHPGFWIAALLMGWRPDEMHITLLWVFVLFLSVLAHELGHALCAEWFGWPAEITLYHFGGYAAYQQYTQATPFKSLIVSAAGPFVGLSIWFLLRLLLQSFAPQIARNELVLLGLFFGLQVNLWMNLMNLIPALPLDGGQMLLALLRMGRVRSATEWALRISVGAAALTAWYAFSQSGRANVIAIMFGLIAIQNLQTLMEDRHRW